MSVLTDYEWLTEMNLCHKCRKNRPAPNRKFCFDCLEKIKKENAQRYNPEQAKVYQKRRREIYQEKKEKGICIRCTKKANHGMYCYEHYIKERRRSMKRANTAKVERHERELIPEARKAKGQCLWCGERAVSGTSACEKHIQIFSDAGRKAGTNDREVRSFWKLTKAENL